MNIPAFIRRLEEKGVTVRVAQYGNGDRWAYWSDSSLDMTSQEKDQFHRHLKEITQHLDAR